MLTDPAFNALLKTLEEPPQHVIFILATTESHKLPLTIISRCQRFDFKRISIETIIAKLNQLCVSENITISNEALQLIAKKSSGSLRDAENLLEQAIISYGNSISETQISSFLDLNTNNSEVDLVTSLITKNISEGLKIIIDFCDSGGNVKQFNNQIVELLRTITLAKAGVNTAQIYNQDIQKHIIKLANLSKLESLSKITKIFSEPLLNNNESNSLNLELAFIQCHSLIHKDSNQTNIIQENHNSKNPQSNQQNTAVVNEKNQNLTPAITTENWKTILSKLRKKGSRFDLSALLRATTERKIENNEIILTYSHASHLERMITELEQIDTKKIFNTTFSQVLGKEFKIVHTTNVENNKNNHHQLKSPLVKAALAKGAQVLDAKEISNE